MIRGFTPKFFIGAMPLVGTVLTENLVCFPFECIRLLVNYLHVNWLHDPVQNGRGKPVAPEVLKYIYLTLVMPFGINLYWPWHILFKVRQKITVRHFLLFVTGKNRPLIYVASVVSFWLVCYWNLFVLSSERVMIMFVGMEIEIIEVK